MALRAPPFHLCVHASKTSRYHPARIRATLSLEKELMAPKPREPLAEELSFFAANRTQWLKSHEGEFVLIADQVAAGFYPSYEQALSAGLKKFGVQAEFLIKQVASEEPVFVIY
jgi:hypothetical protein